MDKKTLLTNNFKKHVFFYGLVGSIILTSILAIFLFDKTMPPAEGWYSYYAKLMNSGSSVYKNFEYLFTPVYISFISFFVKIFGESIICLRILGIFMFVGIAVILYLLFSRCFSYAASMFASVTAVFFLQSEVYSVFYDYVRFMDIFSYLSILFMVITLKNWLNDRDRNCYLCLWGIFSALFVLVKQNMGLIYTVYSLLLLIISLVYFNISLKKKIAKILLFIVSFVAPIIIVLSIICATSNFSVFFSSAFSGAAEAKGGMKSILFNWIVNGMVYFKLYFLEAVVCLIFFLICYRFSAYDKKDGLERRGNVLKKIIPLIGFLSFGVSIICIINDRNLGSQFANYKAVDSYFVFLVNFLLLVIMMGLHGYEIIRKKRKNAKDFPILAILGAFFAISYGAGTSGGLSIGESAIGIGMIICIAYDILKGYLEYIAKSLVVVFCILISMRNISYKLLYPCQWWGIDSSSVYDCTETTDIDDLKGIKVSASEKNVYEGIVNVIKANTTEDDKIYCFPCIPIIYCLSDRMDPGVYSKVQWFDVSTNESLISDIKKIEDNPPKVIVIQNINESTYSGHENAFNLGEESGTRKMRDFLYKFVYTKNYKYISNYQSTNNNYSVFVYDEDNVLKSFQGEGTVDNPYLINTAQELVNWSMIYNRDCIYNSELYFRLNADLYMNDIIWIPAGYYNKKSNIHLDMNNYMIYNINVIADKYTVSTEILIE